MNTQSEAYIYWTSTPIYIRKHTDFYDIEIPEHSGPGLYWECHIKFDCRTNSDSLIFILQHKDVTVLTTVYAYQAYPYGLVFLRQSLQAERYQWMHSDPEGQKLFSFMDRMYKKVKAGQAGKILIDFPKGSLN